jgi:DNA-binding transcriptional regulator YhcF (GntR family)
MPKKVIDNLVNSIIRDIRNHYQEGDKFPSIRDVAEKYQISTQTAQRGIKRLEECGYLLVRKKAGITVVSLQPRQSLDGYKITVISARPDERFNNAFLEGIEKAASEKGVSARLLKLPDIDIQSLAFGEYLLSLDTNSIIALYFSNSALPFYHVLREGMDIVTDIIPNKLPILPSVQTNNFSHAQEAGRIFLERGYRRILVAGYFPLKKNRRFEGLFDIVKDHCDDVQYICLNDLESVHKIDTFMNSFDRHSAVFSADYSTNYILGAKFVQHHIKVKNDNFLVYDCEGDFFSYDGLNPIRKVGPSMSTIGYELCKTLIFKRETGAYPLPLQRKI